MTDTVNVGTTANDGTGDDLRAAFVLINQKFEVVQAGLSPDAQDIVERVEAAAAGAEGSEVAAAGSAAAAQAAEDGAEAARDSSFANAKGAATIAEARALVADTETFIVYAVGAETFSAYRRISSTTEVFLGEYPNSSSVLDVIQKTDLVDAKTQDLDHGYSRSAYSYLMTRGPLIGARRIMDYVKKSDLTRWIYRIARLEFIGSESLQSEPNSRNPWIFRIGGSDRVLIGIKRVSGGQEVHLNSNRLVINGIEYVPGLQGTFADAAGAEDIDLWGDSLTTSAQGYGGEFAALYPDRTVRNFGVSGQEAGEIAARCGMAVTCTVASNTIPASGAVAVTGFNFDPLARLASYSVRARLFGIDGVLARDAINTNTFTRSVAGIAITVPAACPLVVTSTHISGANPAAGLDLETRRKATAIICVGRNDYEDADYSLTNQVVEPLRLQIKALRNIYGRVLVVGCPNGEYSLTAARSAVGSSPSDTESARRLANHRAMLSAMAAEYGLDYVSLQSACQAAGYTSNYTLDGTVYQVTSLAALPDGIHPSTSAQKLFLATAIQTAINTKGW